jgi:hypothetical protein
MIVLRLEDFIKIVQEERTWIRETKSEAKQRVANQPQLMREDD